MIVSDICVKLQQALYGDSSVGIENLQGDIQRLCSLISALRNDYLQTQAQSRKDRDFILPPLYKA